MYLLEDSIRSPGYEVTWVAVSHLMWALKPELGSTARLRPLSGPSILAPQLGAYKPAPTSSVFCYMSSR